MCYSESINAGNVPAAFKAWSAGGVTTDNIITVPTGLTRSYKIALESATLPGFWQAKYYVPAGASVTFTFYLRKDASMSVKPYAQTSLDSQEPLLGGSVLNTYTYPNDTVNAWNTGTYTYTNSDDYDKVLVVRFSGQNATGNVYSALSINLSNVYYNQVWSAPDTDPGAGTMGHRQLQTNQIVNDNQALIIAG